MEKYLKEICMKIPKRAETRISTAYRPDINVTAELGPMDAAY